LASVDQAEGLRRMLEGSRPKVLTFLSALGDEEKSGMLVNLGASLARQGRQVLMVDARSSQESVGVWLTAHSEQTLLDVAMEQRTMQDAIKIISAGLSVTLLSKVAVSASNLPAENIRSLSRVFDLVVDRSDLVIVDGEIDLNDTLSLASLDESELIMQLSANPASIKSAYGLIKRLSNRIGRRSYGILVSGSTEKEAKLVYTNMAMAANRYLAVPLHFLGYIPEDDCMKKAARLGRSVIDVFPAAGASLAFERLAKQFAVTARSTFGFQTVPDYGVRLEI
jgi:flagellar biosynthesis protein FlhG